MTKSILHLFVHNGEMNNEYGSAVDFCVTTEAFLPETLEQAKQLVKEVMWQEWTENGTKELHQDNIADLNLVIEEIKGIYRIDDRTAADIKALGDVPCNHDYELDAIQGAKKRLAHIHRMFCWGNTLK